MAAEEGPGTDEMDGCWKGRPLSCCFMSVIEREEIQEAEGGKKQDDLNWGGRWRTIIKIR